MLWEAKERGLSSCYPMWGEGITLVSFKSFLFNWKMKTSLTVPLYSPKRFCRLEKTVWNKKKINCFSFTVHWEKAFLAFKLAHFSFYSFWLNRVHCTEEWFRKHTWLPRAYSLERNCKVSQSRGKKREQKQSFFFWIQPLVEL